MAGRSTPKPSFGTPERTTNQDGRFATFFRAVILAFLAGWLLVIGKGIILPIFAAVISVYVLTAAADAMGRLPVLRLLPSIARRVLVVIGFTLCFVGLGVVISVTVDELMVAAPGYKANLEALTAQLAGLLGLESLPSWDEMSSAVMARIDVRSLLTGLLSSVTSFGGSLFLIIVYAVFLIAEQGSFARKLGAAFPEGHRAERTVELVEEINRKIGDYLAAKTLINVILGAVSYVILWAMDVDFALFWAVLIGLFNYIPFIGTVAIFFPIVLSLAQFGSFTTALVLGLLLGAVQLVSDNVLEPKLFARQLNLSPFVVIVALSLWSALWGLPGAILAIPMTSMLAIVFAAFPSTRFIAVLLADRIDEEVPGETGKAKARR